RWTRCSLLRGSPSRRVHRVLTANMSTTTQHPVQTPAAVDPNEAGWQEVRDLGLEPEPAGMTPDADEDQA
uniref:hypothetical protein n=1 Tax=Ralstonia pickettii TaxID=329 RepID=UPI002D77F0A6